MSEFVVRVADLEGGVPKNYRFPVTSQWVREALRDHHATTTGEDGLLEVRAQITGGDVLIQAALRAPLSTPCARCLEPANVPVRSELSLLFVPKSSRKLAIETSELGEPVGDESPDVFPYDGETIVLDRAVRDELILETPMIPLCSEACPGIAPSPPREAAPARVDPRLAPLMRFKPKT